MRKIVAIGLVLMLLCATLSGCGGKTNGGEGSTTGAASSVEVKGDPNENATSFEIALITDKGNIDDKSFNQGSWQGASAFAQDNNLTYKYYKPEEASDAGYLAAIDLAVTGGAKVIVTPGFLFEVPVYEAQTKYPDVKFILLDGKPHSADKTPVYKTEKNATSIIFAEEQSGFLAGYAAVKDGYKKLGFMGGMAVPAVQAYGYGYLQGANYAATESNLADGAISVTYHYTGDFAETDTNKATAKTMYQEGTEVIFAAGGSVGKSVMSAAEEAGKKVIGVDVDQRYDSETVITSAMKDLEETVYTILTTIYNVDMTVPKPKTWDNTYSAKTVIFSATNNGIGLPRGVQDDPSGNGFDRFKTFSAENYQEISRKIAGTADGNIPAEIVPIRTITVKDTKGIATAQELTSGLKLTKVTVTVR